MYNIAGQTPCDVAGEAKQLIIAKLLESKMVFMVSSRSSMQAEHKLSFSDVNVCIIVQSQNGGDNRTKVVMSRARNRVSYSSRNGIAQCICPVALYPSPSLSTTQKH